MAKRLDLKDVNIYYGKFHAVADVSLSVPAAERHRVHRSVRLRQVHRAALAQPDARGHPRCPRRGIRAARR